jgi:protein-tyrosine phosphatase
MDETTAWPFDENVHAWWVKPGLLAGEYPGSWSEAKAERKLRLLMLNGVDSFVDLTTPMDGLASYRDDMELAAQITRREIRHFAHPIPDMGVVDHDDYDRIISRICGEIDSGRVVYLHCWGGKGRTCTVIGCLLIDEGLDYDSAIARIAELRAGTRKAAEPCPESAAQHRLLREREARRGRASHKDQFICDNGGDHGNQQRD